MGATTSTQNNQRHPSEDICWCCYGCCDEWDHCCHAGWDSCGDCWDCARCDQRCCHIGWSFIFLIPCIIAIIVGATVSGSVFNVYPVLKAIPFVIFGLLLVMCIVNAVIWRCFERTAASRRGDINDVDLCCSSCSRCCELNDYDTRMISTSFIIFNVMVILVTMIVGLSLVFNNGPVGGNNVPLFLAGAFTFATLMICLNWRRLERPGPDGRRRSERVICSANPCCDSCDNCCCEPRRTARCDSRCCYAEVSILLIILALVALIVGFCTALAVDTAVVNKEPWLRYLPFAFFLIFVGGLVCTIYHWTRYERKPISRTGNDLCCESCYRCYDKSFADVRCCHIGWITIFSISLLTVMIVAISYVYVYQLNETILYSPWVLSVIFGIILVLLCCNWRRLELLPVRADGTHPIDDTVCNWGTCCNSCEKACLTTGPSNCDSRCCYANGAFWLYLWAFIAFIVGITTIFANDTAVVVANPWLRYAPIVVMLIFLFFAGWLSRSWLRYEKSTKSRFPNDLCCSSWNTCLQHWRCDARCWYTLCVGSMTLPVVTFALVAISVLYAVGPALSIVFIVLFVVFGGICLFLSICWYQWEARNGKFGYTDDQLNSAAQLEASGNWRPLRNDRRPLSQRAAPNPPSSATSGNPYLAVAATTPTSPYAPAAASTTSPYAATPYAPTPQANPPPPTNPYVAAAAPPPTNPYVAAQPEAPPSYAAVVNAPAPAPTPAPTPARPGNAVPVTSGGLKCHACQAAVPAGARFCVMCGTVPQAPPPAAPAAAPACACGTPYTPNARFCASCGAAAPKACASCQAVLAPNARFCVMCGATAT